MSTRRAGKSRKLGGCSGLVVIIILGLATTFGLSWGIQFLNAPWSFPALGPTLTGTWSGPLRAARAAEFQLYIDVEYEEPGRSSRINLRGTAHVCNQRGETFDLGLRGTANRAGDRVSLILSPPDDRPAPSITLEGAWQGDTMTLRPTDNPFLPDGTYQAVRTVSTDDPDNSFAQITFRREDRAAFEAACRRLAR